MIKNSEYQIIVSNRNLQIYRNYGYDCNSGESITIKFEHLPGAKKVKCVCDTCQTEYVVTKSKLNDIAQKYCSKHRWEVYSDRMKEFYLTEEGCRVKKSRGAAISKNRIGKGLKPDSHWKDKSKYQKYCADVRRFQRRFNNRIRLLEGYSNIGICGKEQATQIDHIISKKYGYDNSVPPEVIGHICNLQIIPWKENLEKSDTNGMSLETLLNLIDKYERNNSWS